MCGAPSAAIIIRRAVRRQRSSGCGTGCCKKLASAGIGYVVSGSDATGKCRGDGYFTVVGIACLARSFVWLDLLDPTVQRAFSTYERYAGEAGCSFAGITQDSSCRAGIAGT